MIGARFWRPATRRAPLVRGDLRLGKEVKLEGKLVQFVYRNPHSFVHVQAPDEKGVPQRWAVEWGGTGQLARQA